jgi:hypothetical protein
MATPYQLNATVLKGGLEHVCYEYANLISAAHWSINGQAPWRTNVDDAFLLGYRKLRDFLFRGKRSERNLDAPDLGIGMACGNGQTASAHHLRAR